MVPSTAQDVIRTLVGRSQRREQILLPRCNRVGGLRFQMGAEPARGDSYCGESPRHEVVVSEFHLMRTPVTNALYREWRPGHDPEADPDLPVVNVSWHDAVRFSDWLGGRLPTEAEWEAACSRYDGSAGPLTDRAWFSENSGSTLRPVGELAPTPDGIHDLLGNVWEWCQDSYDADYYARSPTTDPVNVISAGDRVCRGGAMNSFEEMCRRSFRHHEPADYWARDLGFRVAVSR